jgi:hypothetical protein
VIVFDERVFGPDSMLQLFPRDDLAGPLKQQRQHLKRLILQLQK